MSFASAWRALYRTCGVCSSGVCVLAIGEQPLGGRSNLANFFVIASDLAFSREGFSPWREAISLYERLLRPKGLAMTNATHSQTLLRKGLTDCVRLLQNNGSVLMLGRIRRIGALSSSKCAALLVSLRQAQGAYYSTSLSSPSRVPNQLPPACPIRQLMLATLAPPSATHLVQSFGKAALLIVRIMEVA